MEHKETLILDTRTTEELREQIAQLAASYTPEWRMDVENPDIGSTLALIFANQMAGNVRRFNQMLDKYQTEFVNMLGISLLPAYPASGVIIGRLLPNTVAGVYLSRGSKLLAATEGVDSLVFETVSDIYITNATLDHVVGISGYFGKIIPFIGDMKPAQILENTSHTVVDSEEENPVISLFDYAVEGVEQNIILFYHKTMFDIGDQSSISIAFPPLQEALSTSDYSDETCFEWSFYNGSALTAFDVIDAGNDQVELRRQEESVPVTVDGADYHLICLKRKGQVVENLEVKEVRVASTCLKDMPEFVSHNSQEQKATQFMPFGDSASLFDECYIGHDRIFGQVGAMISLNFTLSFDDKLVTFTPQQEVSELKVIKRKTQNIQAQTSNTRPQEITLEYYNGIGWRRLECESDWSGLFGEDTQGDINIQFRCPEDWSSIAVSGYNSRCVRIRLIRADNCYLQPCIHTMPVLKELYLSYEYTGQWALPQRMRRITGTKSEDLTVPLHKGKTVALFSTLPYGENALYLGFARAMEGAPVSILFDIMENTHFESAPVAFSYSTLMGFKALQVIDNTHNMAGAGTVVFMPPADFAAVEVEGVKCYWIRLEDEREAFRDTKRYHAQIRSITPNAVEIQNVETLDEQAFHVSVGTANMKFPLSAENILSAEVFVSEHGTLSIPAMQKIIDEEVEEIRVTFDFLGGISSFFVRWNEVENFDLSVAGARDYVIDRMNKEIIFGDGINVMIPPAQSTVAFTVQVKSCGGEKGNLPVGAVNTLFERALYLEQISNPIPTFAGSNVEGIASAHLRGANMVSSRGRLLTELDYMREVMSFSDAITQVKCVAGVDLEGHKDPSIITVALLMRDYANGAHAFNNICNRLRSHLLSRSEATVESGNIILTEPLYVEISLDIWVTADDTQRSFDVQNLIREQIEGFLDPLGKEGKRGWKIGELPSESQVRMMLQSIRGPLQIQRFIVTARYVDRKGSHECTLDNLPSNPFVVGVGGNHRIYMELSHT